MSKEFWQKVDGIYHAALKQAPATRETFLDEACAGDDKLRREVASLLALESTDFLDKPAIELDTKKLAEVTHEPTGQSPKEIGPYRVHSVIGAGGMGEVYLATDKLGRHVALKLLTSREHADQQYVARFLQEAQTLLALNHPNIVTIYDIGQSDSTYYIASELVEGQNLREQMQTVSLDLPAVLDIVIQVATALAAAHDKGIMHRDIKPENVMIRHDGYVKVVDFGLAKLIDTFAAPTSTNAPTLQRVETAEGLVIGTATYMSPEQARGLPVDARTDIWSCGVTLYEMLTGHTPFAGTSVAEVMSHILDHEPAPLARYMTDPPAEIQRIVNKALKKNPSERYQTIKDMLLDLKTLKQDLDFTDKLKRSGSISGSTESKATAITTADLDTRPTSRTETVGERINRNKIGLAIGLSILALTTVVLAYQLIQSRRQRSPNQTQRALSRLTFDVGLQSRPTWSPDGRFLAYSADYGDKGNFDIWVQPVSGGNPIQLTKSKAQDWQPSWSPDGNSIVFRSEREGGGMYLIPAPTGGNERRLTTFGYRPRWSPDGTQILFYDSMLGPNSTRPRIFVATLDGKPPSELLPEFLNEFFGSRTGLNVGWHPDGQHISVLGQHNKLGLGFWTLPKGGGAAVKSDLSQEVEQQIKQSTLEFSDFVWAPSGQALYLEGISKGVKNLWKIGVDPKNLNWISGPERLTTGPGADTEIAISPDGKKLAFTARTERTRVWLAAFDSAKGRTKGEWQPVTSADKDAWFPALSPDGRKLAFIATRSGNQDFWEQSIRDVWVKSLDDGVETLLAGGDAYARFRPTWAPDSQRLAYRRARISQPTEGLHERGLVVKAVGSGEQEILISAGSLNEFVFDWSANGDSLLGNFRNHELGPIGLCLFPIAAAPQADNQPRVITSQPNKSIWQMNFSPDQRWISFNALNLSGPTNSIIYVIPASGGEWIPITDGKYWCDKPRWAPDGKTIYFTSNRTGFSNIWGIRFDLQKGGPVDEPFQVTNFESPSRMISQVGALAEISLTNDRFALDITEMSGNIWILDKIDE